MNRIVYAIIAERRRANVDTGDLRSMLMLTKDEDTGEQMSDQQLRDDVLTMLVAGHETTATAPTWAWGLLDTHPEAAELCYAMLRPSPGRCHPATRSASVARARSGLLVMIPDAPASARRSITAGSSTVQTCTANPARRTSGITWSINGRSQ